MLLLLPPLLVYSILSLFSPRSPSPVYMVSELVGWGREKSKEAVPGRATPPRWGEKTKLSRIKTSFWEKEVYREIHCLRQHFCGRNRVSGALRACFGPREQKSGSSRNLLILEGVLEDRLLQHRDALLKCTQGAQRRLCSRSCVWMFIHSPSTLAVAAALCRIP